MVKKKVKDELKRLEENLSNNLANNYKSQAVEALNDFKSSIEQYHEMGLLKEKDYIKYRQIAANYGNSMINYK